MVHRLKNWVLLRDLMCSNKEIAKNVILQALTSIVSHEEIKDTGRFRKVDIDENVTRIGIDESAIRNMIDSCGCTISQDGLEICLVAWRENLTPLFRNCPGECLHFEEFLSVLDTVLYELKESMAVRHQW